MTMLIEMDDSVNQMTIRDTGQRKLLYSVNLSSLNPVLMLLHSFSFIELQ